MDNNKPFVSTPLMPQLDLTEVNPNPLDVQPMSMMSEDQMENEYPEIYYDVYPMVADAANRLIASGYRPTTEMINALVDTIIKNSGLWYEDDDDDMMPEAIPVQSGFGRNPFHSRRRRHHNRNTIRDIIRILLLRELLGGSRHRSHFSDNY